MHRFVFIRQVPTLALAVFALGAGAASAQEPQPDPGVLLSEQIIENRPAPAVAGPLRDSFHPLFGAGPDPATAAALPTQSALRAAALPSAGAGIVPDLSTAAPDLQRKTKRPAALMGLYASYAALQAFDAHSTARALDRGAVEANPLMRGIAGNAVGMLAIKAAGTAGVVYAGERLWKKNKTAAVLFMAALNSAMVMVVRHNYAAVR